MAWRLRPDMCLEPRRTEGYVALYNKARTPGASDVLFRLHPYQGMALALFDGRRTTDEIFGVVNAVLERSTQDARWLVDSLLRRYRQFLVEGPSSERTESAGPDPADCFFPTSYNFRYLREAAPVALRWVVTEYCDKKCRYCFMNAIYTDNEATPDTALSFERVCEIIDEAARIGVHKMILSGGEPFLRPDLIDVIGVLVDHRIDVIPITKYRFGKTRIKQLAATGVGELHVSLDSHNPQIVADLTGIPDAFDQMVETIRLAVENGLDVVMRPVLAEQNVRDMEELIRLARDLHVKEVLFSKYGQTAGRHEDALLLTPPAKQWLEEQWPILQERYQTDTLALIIDGPGGENDEGCVEGLKSLTFLPNGLATKCEHWRFDDQLIFGDLRHQSLMEAWNSDRLEQILAPGREAYAGTICHHCKNLPHCDYIRGRCSVSALMVHGSPYAPDLHCPIGAYEPLLPGEKRRSQPLLQIQGLTRPHAQTTAVHANGGVA